MTPTPETPMKPRDLLWMAEAKSALSPEMRQHLRLAHDGWLASEQARQQAEEWALSNEVVCARCGHLAVAHGGLGCVRCDATPECRLSEYTVRILGLRAALKEEK